MNISIVTVHTMGRDAFKPKHASSVSISGVIDTGVNSNTGYVISGDHIKIIIDIQKYVVYNRFVHRRVICSIRNNSWIRWQTEMSAFLFSFFVICLIRLNFQQNQLYKEEFQYMEKKHIIYRRKNHAAVTSVCSSCIAGTLSTGYVRCSRFAYCW